MRQVPRETGAALLLIQAALESIGGNLRCCWSCFCFSCCAARGAALGKEALDLPSDFGFDTMFFVGAGHYLFQGAIPPDDTLFGFALAESTDASYPELAVGQHQVPVQQQYVAVLAPRDTAVSLDIPSDDHRPGHSPVSVPVPRYFHERGAAGGH